MLNICVAISVWKEQWSNKHIVIKCDNMAVVECLNSGKMRDFKLGACARNIFFLLGV